MTKTQANTLKTLWTSGVRPYQASIAAGTSYRAASDKFSKWDAEAKKQRIEEDDHFEWPNDYI
jgi:hypothetical protein